MTPEEIILRKNLVLHGGLSSDDWSRVSAALRDRAFFSSRVESARFLATCRDRLAQLLAQTADPSPDSPLPSRAQLVSDIMSAARQTGIATGKGGLTDPSSPRRANVIIDTNAGLAAAYCRAELANSYGARLAFPAQELVRIEERNAKRDWRKRWLANGGKLYAGRMIALKSDPVWVKISRFNQPYPPFDFGSGMGTEDVSREEALALGVIKEDYTPPKSSPLADFNATLEADLKITKTNDPLLKALQNVFGDQIKYNPSTRAISWEGDILNQILKQYTAGDTKGRKAPDVGEISSKFASVLQTDKKTHLRIPGSVLKHIYNGHIAKETDQRSVKMSSSELEFLGRVWRNPETVERGNNGAFVLSQRAPDNNIYRLIVTPDKNGGVKVNTFYKKRSGAEPNAHSEELL